MHRKINIFIAILVIVIVAGLAAWAITAQAFGGKDESLLISSPKPVKCIQDPDAPTCYGNCRICGDIIGCSSLWEVQAKRLSGAKGVLYKNMALCLSFPFPPNSGRFRSGVKCVGKVKALPDGSHLLSNFSCSQR